MVKIWWSRQGTRFDRPLGPPNEFEAGVLLACAAMGLVTLTHVAAPSSLEQTLNPLLLNIWAATMTIGALLALIGLYWWGCPVDGLKVKRAGLVFLAGVTAAYSVAGALLGDRGVNVAIVMGVFAWACVHRIAVISQVIRVIEKIKLTGGS